MSVTKTFVDTNVLVYSVDQGAGAKRTRAHQVLAELKLTGFVLNTQVLQEFYVTATRKLPQPLTPSVALEIVRNLLALVVVPADGPLVLQSIELAQRHQISLWDALIVRSALSAGCTRLLTEDLQDGQRIEGLLIENPFRGL
jgi:predicted nucleic acid-binding protein